VAHADRRRLLLDAAVRVFARAGYHDCRVDDIAREAGVAHGLLYHYFSSKEEVLETIFRETWSQMLSAVRDVERSGEPALVQVRKVAAIVLRSWARDPDLIRVLVREITRSPHLQREVREIQQAFVALERIVKRGQDEGEFRDDLDPRLASQVLYGALEQILTAWVMNRPPASEGEIARAEETVVAMLTEGLVRQGAGVRA
jgi:TetR/AcrR family transcriptional regulator, fatty acid metabolism regulator protein